MAHQQHSDAPRRGTRPRNRRALIVAAATVLFYERGFDQVGMADVASAVGIGPSALYRHFAGKQALLFEVIITALAPMHAAMRNLDLTHGRHGIDELAETALASREIGMLWQREARHLGAEDQGRARSELREASREVTEHLLRARPELSPSTAELLTWSTVAVLNSVSFHHLAFPGRELEEQIAELVNSVLRTSLDAELGTAAAPSPAPRLVPRSRREALLAQAVQMFAAEGYSRVGIEDIGAAVGIAGPSVYYHFASKLDMLVTAVSRGTSRLFLDVTAIYDRTRDPSEVLRQLIASYVDFGMNHHAILDLLITETRKLPDDKRRTILQEERDYVSEWVHALCAVDRSVDPALARVRVHAAMSVVNDIARTPRIASRPGTPAALEVICGRVLQPPPRPAAVPG